MQQPIGITLLGGYAHTNGCHEGLPRKSRALLAYLAMHGARGATREQISDLFWDSSDAARARHSLRQCLTSLRRGLGEGARDPIVSVDRLSLAIRSSAIDVDVHRFEALAHSEKIADLAAASELYQGPFLDGFNVEAEPFQAWARSERARWEGVAADVLRRLSKAAAEAGDSQAAIVAARRLTALDPLNESDQQTLMRLLLAAGHRVEALRSYERLRDALRAELDVAPNETTKGLARALRAESHTNQDSARDGRIAAGTNETLEREPAGAASSTLPDGVPSVRPLAILACEWIGIEALPDERQAEAITTCYRQCGEWLESQGARVARNASDGIIAYFGYEETREQDAENCARAALELRSLTASFNQKFGAAFQLCAGVACGRVIVRTQPGEKGPEAVGSAVNLACWLNKMAAPGEILIEPRARKLVGGLFDYGASRFVGVRGFADQFEVAPILSETGTESRFEALRPRSLGPMVGREEEIERLSRRWRQVIAGEGAVVLLVGEPGIGKSRLVRAFLDQLAEPARASLRLFCSPHGAHSPLHPFTNFLKRAAGVNESDSTAERRSKLVAMIADAKLPPETAAWLAPILGMSEDGGATTAIPPSVGRERLLKALTTLIEARALMNSSAALVVIEDVHWADPTTIEWLDRFAETASAAAALADSHGASRIFALLGGAGANNDDGAGAFDDARSENACRSSA